MTSPSDPTPPVKAKLRPLVDIAHDIIAILEANDGEIDAKLIALDLELETKVEAYAVVVRELEAKAEANKALANHYKTQAVYAEHAIDRALQRCDYGLRAAGVQDVKTRTAHAFYRTDKVVEVNAKLFRLAYEETRPELFRFSDPEPNKSAIKEVLNAGEQLEQVTVVTRTSLQLR